MTLRVAFNFLYEYNQIHSTGTFFNSCGNWTVLKCFWAQRAGEKQMDTKCLVYFFSWGARALCCWSSGSFYSELSWTVPHLPLSDTVAADTWLWPKPTDIMVQQLCSIEINKWKKIKINICPNWCISHQLCWLIVAALTHCSATLTCWPINSVIYFFFLFFF